MSKRHLEAALEYSRRGWSVFPVHGIVDGRCSCRRECSSPGKHPLVRRGLHEATTDQHVIKGWWGRWPNANVAIATGPIVVIDVDLPRGLDSLDLIPELPRTLVSLTGGGGVHLFFAATWELRNHVSRLPGVAELLPGIDLRANGGYVVVPPSLHLSGNRYAWLDPTVAVARAPDWLQEPPRPTPEGDRPSVAPAIESTPYGLAALRGEIDTLLTTPVGRRNDQLNRSAFALGRLIASGHVSHALASQVLQAAALRIGLPRLETVRTTTSGLSAGLECVVGLSSHNAARSG